MDTSIRRSSPRFGIHRYQVQDNHRELQRDYINRSIFGYIAIFNLLPDVVFLSNDEPVPISVQTFQKNLTMLLRIACNEIIDWIDMYSPRISLVGHPLHTFRNLDNLD